MGEILHDSFTQMKTGDLGVAGSERMLMGDVLN
jgi:hypothetical protein